jgi:hypothetical protein
MFLLLNFILKVTTFAFLQQNCHPDTPTNSSDATPPPPPPTTSTGSYFKIVSLESTEGIDDQLVESKFVLQINSLPMENITIILPNIRLDVYEENVCFSFH